MVKLHKTPLLDDPFPKLDPLSFFLSVIYIYSTILGRQKYTPLLKGPDVILSPFKLHINSLGSQEFHFVPLN